MEDLDHVRYTDGNQFQCLENLRETSMELSLISCGKEHCQPMHVFQQQRDDYVLHFVLSGKGVYSTYEKSWTVEAGQMFLVLPGTSYSYIADVKDPWYYAWIRFSGLQAEGVMRECGFSWQAPGVKNLVLDAPDQEDVLRYIDRILKYRHLNEANDLRRRAAMMELMGLLIDENTLRSTAEAETRYENSTNLYVTYAVEYIRAAYQDGINVSDIADYIGISRTYLNTSFQKELGISTHKFLIDYRLHKAASLLLNTLDPINEIAEAVGYNDALAFSKAFKKKFNVSPQNYRVEQQSLEQYDKKQ